MKMKGMAVSFILICNLLFYFNALILPAQEKRVQYKVEVKEKLLYVLALDKDGNPVTDLKKEDFQLFVDGQPQEIETFLLLRTSDKKLEEEKEPVIEARDIKDIVDKEITSNKRFKLAIIPYRFISHDRRNRTERAIKYLVEQARYPEDWIAVIELRSDRIRTIQDFTNAKEKLLQKVDAYFKYDTERFKALEAQYPLTLQEISQVTQLPIFRGIISLPERIDIIQGLKIIAERMGVLPGRKIIYAFNLPIIFLDEFGYRAKYFFEMIEEMLSNNITIYYTELTAPHAAGPFDGFFNPSRAYFGPISHLQYYTSKLAALRFLPESCQFALANETGGKYYHNISKPTYFIDDVNKMNKSYYLLSFPITEQLGKNKYHDIRLECKREGIKLYYSNKYYAPHELEEKKFVESYKRIQLYKYLFSDYESAPSFAIAGQWIPLPSTEENLQFGAIDYYLPPELFHKLPKCYQLGCSYKDAEEEGIIFQEELTFAANKKNIEYADHGYVVRVLVNLPAGEKSLRLAAMDSENGDYGKIDLDVREQISNPVLSKIMLGRLMSRGRYFEAKDHSEMLFNIKKQLYDLLSINNSIIIPSTDNIFQSGEQVAICLVQKISEAWKNDKNLKIIANLSYLGSEEGSEKINAPIPLHLTRATVQKDYFQYYEVIDTNRLAAREYRLEINIMDEGNKLIDAMGTYFTIITQIAK
jgi:VWFA-related protein